jgi:hypothetical protein
MYNNTEESPMSPIQDRVGAYWSPEEELILRQLIGVGVSWDEIPRVLGRSIGAVRGRAIQLGLQSKGPTPRTP